VLALAFVAVTTMATVEVEDPQHLNTEKQSIQSALHHPEDSPGAPVYVKIITRVEGLSNFLATTGETWVNQNY